MVSTIKIKSDDKIRLDDLRAKLFLHGINLNQEELLSRLLDLGENFLLDLKHIPMKKLTEKEKDKIRSRVYKMGISSQKSVDRSLYGEY